MGTHLLTQGNDVLVGSIHSILESHETLVDITQLLRHDVATTLARLLSDITLIVLESTQVTLPALGPVVFVLEMVRRDRGGYAEITHEGNGGLATIEISILESGTSGTNAVKKGGQDIVVVRQIADLAETSVRAHGDIETRYIRGSKDPDGWSWSRKHNPSCRKLRRVSKGVTAGSQGGRGPVT